MEEMVEITGLRRDHKFDTHVASAKSSDIN